MNVSAQLTHPSYQTLVYKQAIAQTDDDDDDDDQKSIFTSHRHAGTISRKTNGLVPFCVGRFRWRIPSSLKMGRQSRKVVGHSRRWSFGRSVGRFEAIDLCGTRCYPEETHSTQSVRTVPIPKRRCVSCFLACYRTLWN